MLSLQRVTAAGRSDNVRIRVDDADDHTAPSIRWHNESKGRPRWLR